MHRMPTIADFLTHFKPTEADKRADILSTRSSSAYKHERKIMMTDEWKFIYACVFGGGFIFSSCFLGFVRQRCVSCLSCCQTGVE